MWYIRFAKFIKEEHMKELIPMDSYGIFADMKSVVRANSLMVAQMFGKRHDDVLKVIRRITAKESGLSEDFNRRNFAEIKYTDDRGRKQPCFALTRDGFTLLTMGFSGKKAMRFKEAYINRFNQMERQLEAIKSARQDYLALTDAICLAIDSPRPYHYSNEADMINRIVTGYSTKQFREINNIPKGGSIRPYLTPAQIVMLEMLQKVDTGLLVSTPEFKQRKALLENYKVRLEQRLMAA